MMDKVRLALIAIGSLATTGAAFAVGTVLPDSFHGVRVLDAQSMEESGDGASAVAKVKLGPYPTDAVVLVQGGSEAHFNQTGLTKLGELRTELREDGNPISSNAKKATATASGWAPTALRSGFGSQKIFIKRGEIKNLQLDAETSIDLDASKIMVASRLITVAVAAQN